MRAARAAGASEGSGAGGAVACELWRAGPRGAILVVKPLTFMNASGEALAALARSDPFAPADLLVICDDVNLPLGRLRVRRGGSDGGHNGLLSVSLALGTNEYPRLRLGVGPRPAGLALHDFVLGPFGADEEDSAEALVERGSDAAAAFAARGIDAAMREFNGAPGSGDADLDERG